MADFTADPFNFENELWESFRRFIERLRSLLAVRYSHNRAATYPEENPPTRFFDIVLQTNTHNFRVRIRRDNLYLVGYQMQDSNQWLELRYNRSNNPVNRIAGSTFLGFGDTYAQLRHAAGVQAPSGIQVGRRPLIDAINSLATSTRDHERARSLLIVIVMIIESLRFDSITTYFVTGTTPAEMVNGVPPENVELARRRRSSPFPDWIDRYVHGWADLSAVLLHADADNSFRLPDINNFNSITTFEAAAAIIGILKGFGPPGGQGRRRRAAYKGENMNEQYSNGRPLVEVFSVTINNIHGNQNTIGDFYGTIQVSDGLGHGYVYNRQPNGSESIRTSETALLNGPARCISAYNNFTIDVTLMSKEGLSEDDEISKGQISWDIRNISTNEYDKLLFREVRGRFGSATVSYAVLSDAVVATVEVMLIKKGDPADVYGLLTSHNVNLNSESVLFRKAHNKFIKVKNGEVIPLSRSVVAVPLNSNFIVRADLKGSNIFSSDDEIAKGTATFSPKLSGTSDQKIDGKNSQIRVKVTWSWYV